MKKLRAVLLDSGTLGDGVSLESLYDLPLELTVYEKTTPETVLERVQEAEVVLCNKVVLNRSTMSAATKLKYIGVLATGMNNVDLDAAADLGIEVRNLEGYCTASVAQHTMALMLSLANSLGSYSKDAANGSWADSDMFCLLNHPIMELKGKTLLVVGYGNLGSALATLAEAFGMKVLKARIPGSSSTENRIELDEGLAVADVVSLHCPLTEHTRNLIDKRRLSLMKHSALLINTSRGGLVDEAALVSALSSGKLGGAGFDVLTEEPPRNGNVLLDAMAGGKLPNLIVTPHCAWASPEARQTVIALGTENLADYLESEQRSVQ